MSENLNVFITRDENFLWYSLKKSKFSFYFNVYMPIHISDVITNVTIQNMNDMAVQCLTCETLARQKRKKKKKKKIGKSK